MQLYYKDDVLYVSYKSKLGNSPLKLKISKENINASVLAICEMLSLDKEQISLITKALASAQSFMEGAGVETVIDLNKLSLISIVGMVKSAATSSVEESESLSLSEILNVIKGISINTQNFSVTLPASILKTSSEIKFSIGFNDGEIESINIYSFDGNLIADAVSGLGIDLNNKKIDLSVTITPECEKVTEVEGEYINLDGVDEIIKSAANALDGNKAFTLSGKINAGLILSGKSYNIEDVQVNITANMGENGLEMLIDLPKIPVVFPGIVFQTASSERSSKIYYNNGMVYIYRFDDFIINSRDKTYKYSCTKEWCFANFAEVLGYALGFTDTIVNKIDESINSVDENAPAGVIENILQNFIASTSNETSKYSITFSGSALTQNTMLGNMTAIIATNNQTHTITQIGIDMVFVNYISLSGMLDFMAYSDVIAINFNTSGYEFKG